MPDIASTSLLVLVLGKIGYEIISDTCKDYLKGKLASVFERVGVLGRRDEYERALDRAFTSAVAMHGDTIVAHLRVTGCTDEELKSFAEPLKAFLGDEAVLDELYASMQDTADATSPSASRLGERWQALCADVPMDEGAWGFLTRGFRTKAGKLNLLSEPLLQVTLATDLHEIRRLLEAQGEARPDTSPSQYAQRMKTKYAAVDLANLAPSDADDPGGLVIRDVFVPLNVREDPPRRQLPKDFLRRLRERGYEGLEAPGEEGLPEDARERALAEAERLYVSRPSAPALDVVSREANRLLLITGDPGAGKSTLMRYLLLGVFDPPADAGTREPLPWTRTFAGALPLLIELRDFNAMRQRGECDSFLEYVHYMGKADSWAVDRQWVHDELSARPSLVMFDGLDEIFDPEERERVSGEIVGFAQSYPQCRVIVTSRPMGLKRQPFTQAGFRHFHLQDLEPEQIEAFTRGWFDLVFPGRPEDADQRVRRVLDGVERSASIRLLAGNPMLLTLMALIARERALPRERVAFYAEAVKVLVHNWDANHHMPGPDPAYLDGDDKTELLQAVAVAMHDAPGGLEGNAIHGDDLESVIEGFLLERKFVSDAVEAKAAARGVIATLHARNHVLCLRGPKLYGFVHRTFLEYLVALDYVDRFQRTQQLKLDALKALYLDHYADAEWQEVLRLIAGQIAERFVGELIEGLIDRAQTASSGPDEAAAMLTLAIYCLSETRNPNALGSAGGRLFEEVREWFERETGSWAAREGVLGAAREIGTRWPGATPPTDATGPLFRDVAAPVWVPLLATVFEDRGFIESLARRGEDRLGRGAAVDALASHWPDASARALIEGVAREDKDGYARGSAIRALAERWPDASSRALIEGVAREGRDRFVRGFALGVLASHWPDASARALIEGAAREDKDGYARVSALGVLAEHWPDGSARALIEGVAREDEDGSARGSALEALASRWPDASVRALIEQVAREDKDRYDGFVAKLMLAEHWPDSPVLADLRREEEGTDTA